MRLVVLVQSLFPDRTSAAVQMMDLAVELSNKGHHVTIITPSSDISRRWTIELIGSVRVMRIWSPKTRDIGFVRRTLAESMLSFFMVYSFAKSPLRHEIWDGLIWYSPTIFFGSFVRALKKNISGRTYLVLRDIFPDWAVDLGLLKKGLLYKYFKLMERKQYIEASVIGVQSPGNLRYFDNAHMCLTARIEVLHNWQAAAICGTCSINVATTPLSGRKIFVYIGNMGLAQNMDILLSVASRLKQRNDLGFLFIGRGTRIEDLRQQKRSNNLDNVLIFDEVDASEIPPILAQCHIGLITLDTRHRTHNIPGKFLSYLFSGLPVLANINQGNDLGEIIQREKVGQVNFDGNASNLTALAEKLLQDIESDSFMNERCKLLARNMFSVSKAAEQIITRFTLT